MRTFSCCVVTVSDGCTSNRREDTAGPLLARLLSGSSVGLHVTEQLVIPDDQIHIEQTLKSLSQRADLIVTTGGTGLSPRDVTPEATLAIAEKIVPGIPEMLRSGSAEKTQYAWLSRGAAVIHGRCLIINLPGNPKAVEEQFAILESVLRHALEIAQSTSGSHEVHRPPEAGSKNQDGVRPDGGRDAC